MPTLRHLKIFAEVAKCEKMVVAAQNLFLSQSTVSQTILELENYYNIVLFERLSKNLQITEAGRALLVDAQRILDDFDKLEEHMADWKENVTIRVGVSGPTSAMIITDVVDKLIELLPKATIKVFSYAPKYCEKHLCDNNLDILITENAPIGGEIIADVIARSNVCFICGKNHRFFGRDYVALQDLSNERFVMPGSSSAICHLIQDLLQENNIQYTSDWTAAHDSGTTELWTAQNHGISASPEMLIPSQCASGRLSSFKLSDHPIIVPTYIAYHKNKYISKALKTFIMASREVGARL